MKTLRTQLVAVVLSAVIVTTACTANWIKVALADLPVLVQMALNIATLVSAVQGAPIPAGEQTAITNIGAQANNDLTQIQALYAAYQAAPNATNLQKIQDAITAATQQLPALLAAADIKDPVLLERVTAAVNLISSTLNSFLELIPSSSAPAAAAARATAPVPTPKQLKALWNTTVCPSTGACKL